MRMRMMTTPARIAVFAVLAQVAACAPGGQPSAGKDLPVYLNHLYLVVDARTYDAISGSAFVKDRFAAFSQDATVTGDGAFWSGAYLEGRRTYIELFRASAERPAGTSGIGLGVEQEGGIERCERRLLEAGLSDFSTGLQTRARGAEQVPWFYLLEFKSQSEGLLLEYWIMEYHRDYLRGRRRDLPAAPPGITREEYQARSYDPSRLLEDVTGLTVALYPEQSRSLLATLSALGYATERSASVSVAIGPGVEIRLVEAGTGQRGVVEVRMATKRMGTLGERRFSLGCSVLSVRGDGTAAWRFVGQDGGRGSDPLLAP